MGVSSPSREFQKGIDNVGETIFKEIIADFPKLLNTLICRSRRHYIPLAG